MYCEAKGKFYKPIEYGFFMTLKDVVQPFNSFSRTLDLVGERTFLSLDETLAYAKKELGSHPFMISNVKGRYCGAIDLVDSRGDHRGLRIINVREEAQIRYAIEKYNPAEFNPPNLG